jgi:hypothetical protein
MTDVARDWATIEKWPYSQLRSIFVFFAARQSSAKSQCIASPVVVQTHFVFLDRSNAFDSAIGSEIVPLPIKPAASDEVAASNPPGVSLQDDVRSNGNTACIEFSKRWSCKRSL